MLKKQYPKSKDVCKVPFYAAPELDAEKATVEQAANCSYQFRCLVNDSEWRNDWQADGYQPNPFDGDNSVVEV